MKPFTAFCVTGSLLLLTALFACKRNDDTSPDTNATRIIGSWRETYRAVDSNENGQADSVERITTNYYRVVSFSGNGTVHDTMFFNGVASATDASYTLTGDFLTIHFPGIPAVRILQLDTASLLLSDTTRRPAMITVFSKQ